MVQLSRCIPGSLTWWDVATRDIATVIRKKNEWLTKCPCRQGYRFFFFLSKYYRKKKLSKCYSPKKNYQNATAVQDSMDHILHQSTINVQKLLGPLKNKKGCFVGLHGRTRRDPLTHFPLHHISNSDGKGEVLKGFCNFFL